MGGIFFGRIFSEDVFERKFLGENFGRIFLGGILTLLKLGKLFEYGRN